MGVVDRHGLLVEGDRILRVTDDGARVSTHALAWRRPTAPSRRTTIEWFQLTPSREGRRPSRERRQQHDRFRPTPSREGRLVEIGPLTAVKVFQPTPSREGRPRDSASISPVRKEPNSPRTTRRIFGRSGFADHGHGLRLDKEIAYSSSSPAASR